MADAPTTATATPAATKKHWWQDKAFAVQVAVTAGIAAAAAYFATKTAQR